MEQIPQTMRAVAYTKSLPIEHPDSFEDVELPVPQPGPRDLLVRVEAVAVNPVDYKIRQNVDPGGTPKVLGWETASSMNEALEMAKGNTPHASPEITLLHMPPILMAEVTGAPPPHAEPPRMESGHGHGNGHANGNGTNGHAHAKVGHDPSGAGPQA